MIDPADLIEPYIQEVPRIVASSSSRWVSDPHLREELISIGYEVLVKVANDWVPYCERHGYDPNETQYFRFVVYRRIVGAVKDFWRTRDPLTRTKREKYRATGVMPPTYEMRTAVISDLSEPIRTAENLPEAGHLTSVHEAQQAAYDRYLALNLGQQTALACRLTHDQLQHWQHLWSPKSTRRAGPVSLAAAREIHGAVCVQLGLPVRSWPVMEKLAHTEDWKPTPEFLDYLGCSAENHAENFGAMILEDPGMVNVILDLAMRLMPSIPRSSPSQNLDEAPEQVIRLGKSYGPIA